jgi:hypothetical protein
MHGPPRAATGAIATPFRATAQRSRLAPFVTRVDLPRPRGTSLLSL